MAVQVENPYRLVVEGERSREHRGDAVSDRDLGAAIPAILDREVGGVDHQAGVQGFQAGHAPAGAAPTDPGMARRGWRGGATCRGEIAAERGAVEPQNLASG